ncbi:MAG: TonB-dependent siderophore receptor [Brevundimonas sp.]|nr:TonB-dependent siderophore receptor [Brevundimonas sp.]
MRPSLFGLLASVSCMALTNASPTWAQQEEPTTLSDIVVTGSQVSLPPAYAGGQVATGGRVGLFGSLDTMDTPFSSTSFTEDLVRNQQARSVAAVLQNDPAVRVSKGFGNFQELYIIRGFPVFSDDMTYNGLYGVLPRQYVAAELLERVEVFRGATAFLNGAAPGGSGVGGAVNLVPKRARNAPLTRLTAGWEGGDEIYAAADVSRRFGEGDAWGLRLNLASRAGEGSVEGESRAMTVLGLGLDRRGDRARFSADLGWQDNRIDAPRPQVTPAGAIPKPPSADKNFAQPWTYTNETQLFGALRGEFDVTDAITIWAAVGGREGKERNSLANPTAQADGSMSSNRFDNGRRDQVFSADVGVRADFDTGLVGHRLVASAAQVQTRESNSYAFSDFRGFVGNIYDPVFVPAPPADALIAGSLTDPTVVGRVKTTSFAVADMISFLDGRVLATVGARYQEIDTRSYDYNTTARTGGYASDAVTPVFALVYKPSDRVSLYANYSEALLPGKIAPGVINNLPVANAGEVLEPFRAQQAEVGVKYDGGAFGGTLSAFTTTLPSELFDPADRLYSAGGEQKNRGVELTVFGEPVMGLRLLGGATWLDAEIKRALDASLDGKSPIGVPEFQANLNVEWDVPALAGLTLEGRAVHTGAQPASADNAIELDSWTRFDAGVRYAFEAGGQPLTLRARVENLADDDQWVAVGGYPGSNYLTLGAPRTLRLSISTEF